MEKVPNINISKKANIGYFSQNLNILDEDKTIIENLLELNELEQDARDILARDVYKRQIFYLGQDFKHLLLTTLSLGIL